MGMNCTFLPCHHGSDTYHKWKRGGEGYGYLEVTRWSHKAEKGRWCASCFTSSVVSVRLLFSPLASAIFNE